MLQYTPLIYFTSRRESKSGAAKIVTRRSLSLRSQVNMGTEGQGYGDWTNTHDNGAIGRAFFPQHASVKSSALRRKMTEL